MKINQRECVFLALTLAILLGAWLGVIRPRNQAAETMLAEMAEKERLLEQLIVSYPRAVDNLEKDIQHLEAILREQTARLPQEENIDDVFRDLSSLARAHHLRMHQMQTHTRVVSSEEAESNNVAEQGFVLELEGSFSDLYEFLEALENQPRLLRIDELKIQWSKETDAPGETKNPLLRASLRLRTFYRNEENLG